MAISRLDIDSSIMFALAMIALMLRMQTEDNTFVFLFGVFFGFFLFFEILNVRDVNRNHRFKMRMLKIKHEKEVLFLRALDAVAGTVIELREEIMKPEKKKKKK